MPEYAQNLSIQQRRIGHVSEGFSAQRFCREFLLTIISIERVFSSRGYRVKYLRRYPTAPANARVLSKCRNPSDFARDDFTARALFAAIDADILASARMIFIRARR